MLVARDTVSLRTPIEIFTSTGAPALSLTHATSGLVIQYRRPSDADWVTVTKVAGSSTYTAGGFRSLGENLYEFCWPNAAIVSGESTAIRVTYQGVSRSDVIDARLSNFESTAVSALIADSVAAKLTGLRLTAEQQAALSGKLTLFVYKGDDYADDPTRIDIDQTGMANPTADLSSYKLVISFVDGANTIGLRMAIEGDPGEHYATFDPTYTVTETLTEGTFPVLFRIEYGTNRYKTITNGTLVVEPHDVDPADMIDL